jgi:hypothetical protein
MLVISSTDLDITTSPREAVPRLIIIHYNLDLIRTPSELE